MPILYSENLKNKLDQKLKRNPELGSSEFQFFVCSPQYARARHRVEKWLDEFPDIVANRDALNRFLLPESFRQSIAEIVAGVAAKRTGYSAEFSPSIDGKTPDWLLTKGDRSILLEVTTISPSRIRLSAQRRIQSLQSSLGRLAFGVALTLDCSNREAVSAYSQLDQREGVETVRRWLAERPAAGSVLDLLGFQIRIEKWIDTQRRASVNLKGLSFHSDPTLLEQSIVEKVKRYGPLSTSNYLPFWILLEALDGSGLNREALDEILNGHRRLISKREVDRGSAYVRRILSQSRGVFEAYPDLSGIIWMESDLLHNEWILLPIENPFARIPTHMAFREVRFLKKINPIPEAAKLIIDSKVMRFFLIFWVAELVPKPGGPVTAYGQRAYMSETFLGRDELEADLLKTRPEFESVTIWNLMELSHEDFLIWTSKDRRRLEPRYEFDELIVYD